MGALAGLLVLFGLWRLAFPGDVSFIADEPSLIHRALDALDAGRPVGVGLVGTRGLPYGPVPSWLYQVGLLFTSDPRWLVVGKVVGVTALTGFALVRLATRLPRLIPVLGAFAFLSPYLWFYARDLWDNSFAIPFSAMVLAAYVDYLAKPRPGALVLTAVFATACLLTHFMTAPLLAAVAVHFALARRSDVLASRRLAIALVGAAALAGAVSLPYLARLSGDALGNLIWTPSWRSLLFAADGFRTFSLVGFDYVIGTWSAGGMGLPARLLTLFTYLAGSVGVYELVRAARSDEPSVERDVARVVSSTLVFWFVLANGTRLSIHPHYYNGVWVAFFVVWWLGMSRLVRVAWVRRVFAAQTLVMGLFLVGLPLWLNQNRGTRSLHYGPTLENQMSVARALDSLGVVGHPPSAAHHPRLFPQAIGVLRRLNERAGGPVSADSARAEAFEIEYVEPEGSGGAIVLRRTVSPTEVFGTGRAH